MEPTDIDTVVNEIERRFRERTPATRVDEVLASYRGGRSEIRRWCIDNGIELDELDPAYVDASNRMFSRLRREFKNDRWTTR